MMTAYEEAIVKFAEASGEKLDLPADRVATLMADGRVVQLKPSGETEDGMTAFTAVARTEDGAEFSRETLATALSLNLFGTETLGANLGLFADTIFLSKEIALVGITSEALAEELLAFARLAADIEKRIGVGLGEQEAVTHSAEEIGKSGFIQV